MPAGVSQRLTGTVIQIGGIRLAPLPNTRSCLYVPKLTPIEYISLTDDFDDNSTDAAKWSVGQFYPSATTSGTLAEQNGRVEITPAASVAGNKFTGYSSVNTFDLTGKAIALKVMPQGTVPSGQQVHLSFGANSPGNQYQILIAGTSLQFYKWIGNTFTLLGSTTYNSTTHAWLRLRHGGADDTLYADAAPSSASDPPLDSEWTNLFSSVRAATVSLTAGTAAFGTGTTASTASPVAVYFDGFNTATTAGASNITGTASPSISSFTSSSAAKVYVKASASPALNGFTSAGADHVLVKGAASGILSAFSSTSAARVRVKASSAVAPSNFVSTSVGKVRAKADASVSLASFTGAAVGLVRAKAAASVAPNAFISAAAAKALIEGTGSGALNAFGSTSVTKVRVKAAASLTPSAFTTTASGHVVSAGITASASPALAVFGSSAIAVVRIKGAASAAIGSFISASAAKDLVEGLGGGTLNAFTGVGTAKTKVQAAAQPALDVFGSAVTAKIRIAGVATLSWGPLTVTATLVGPVAPPVPDSRTISVGKVRSVLSISAGRSSVSVPAQQSHSVSPRQRTVSARGARWRG